jgi:hypothetical protein
MLILVYGDKHSLLFIRRQSCKRKTVKVNFAILLVCNGWVIIYTLMNNQVLLPKKNRIRIIARH